jgi:hypothetical protein
MLRAKAIATVTPVRPSEIASMSNRSPGGAS